MMGRERCHKLHKRPAAANLCRRVQECKTQCLSSSSVVSAKTRAQHLCRALLQAHAQRAPAQLERRRKSSGEVAADEDLSRDEVIRRLRALEQPVTLFGEVRYQPGTPGWHAVRHYVSPDMSVAKLVLRVARI